MGGSEKSYLGAAQKIHRKGLTTVVSVGTSAGQSWMYRAMVSPGNPYFLLGLLGGRSVDTLFSSVVNTVCL
ncbi:hypothetical protein RRG08_033280 [Elysia crispata]|uniref:Uncharacterized protein n=1 Tax=Elysia crispata TaxID=231223 RepID=A0AAE0XRI4_9GAST|nr:hypothetical protein RRG08_033280 [Elysia crispata]